MARRFSVNSVLDVTGLDGYYNRLDVYVAFTDNGDFDFKAEIDGNIRPEGIYAYRVNDVVGRRSRESTLYARVFRYRERSKEALDVQQFRMDDYELLVQKTNQMYPEMEEEIDLIYALIPGQLQTKTAFAHFWQFTFRVAVKLASSRSEIMKEWARLILDLGIEAIVDKRGTGVISPKRRACIIVLGKEYGDDVEDLEIISTQVHKKEQNSHVRDRIARFNRLTKVSNARNRIKKW